MLWLIKSDKLHTSLIAKYDDRNSWSLTDCYSATYRSFLMLGSSTVVESTQRKIAYLSIMILGMICYWLWEAQLISYFSFPSKSLPFNNLEEFLEKSDNKVCVVWISISKILIIILIVRLNVLKKTSSLTLFIEL